MGQDSYVAIAPLRIIEAGVHPIANDADFCAWLTRHGIEPTLTYEVEVIGEDYIVARQWALDDDGKKHADPVTGQPAEREPFAVVVQEPMPA